MAGIWNVNYMANIVNKYMLIADDPEQILWDIRENFKKGRVRVSEECQPITTGHSGGIPSLAINNPATEYLVNTLN